MGTEFVGAARSGTLFDRLQPGFLPPIPSSFLTDSMIVSWIHHDNMLEGSLFRPSEILQALAEQDEGIDRYLHPLMQKIRRYRQAIELTVKLAEAGVEAVNLENLKRIHRNLTPKPDDRGGLYRRTSPVHRDYFQKICGAEKVPYHLRKMLDHLQAEAVNTLDPVALAAGMHHRLMHAYPFRRNPGTSARLFTNLALMAMGCAPAIIPAQCRPEYYKALAAPEATALIRLYREAVRCLVDQRHQTHHLADQRHQARHPVAAPA